MPQSCESLKTFTTVNKINDKLEFHYCLETVNVPEKFSKCNLDKLRLCELTNEDKWLTSFYDDVSEPTSWTGYHEKQSRDKTGNILTINVPLPLIHYKSSSVELQFHLMRVVVDYTKYLNPGQVAVGVSDLPLYALKRSIQMAYPEEFEGYFCIMGGLHIEQAALVCIGQLIKDSGLDDIVDAASLDTVGLKTAVCDVNNIEKARYTLQVVAQLSRKNSMMLSKPVLLKL